MGVALGRAAFEIRDRENGRTIEDVLLAAGQLARAPRWPSQPQCPSSRTVTGTLSTGAVKPK
jgi:hypothetical protein